MKRIMTLVGAIIGTVFTAIYAIVMLIGITAILEMLGGAPGAVTVAIVGIIETALGVVALVFDAIAITAFSCSAEKFAAKRKLLIAAIVLNFVLAMLLLISMFTSFATINLLVFLACIAASVLIIVDLCLENKRAAALAAEQPAEQPAEAAETKEQAE